MENKNRKIPLVIWLSVFIVCALLLHVDRVVWWDYEITERIADAAHIHWLAVVVDLISECTIGSYVGVMTVIVYLLWERKKQDLIRYIYWVGWLLAISFCLKNFFSRMRPYVVIDTVHNLSSGLLSDRMSFPSSHSTLAFFTASFLVSFFGIRGGKKWSMYFLATVIALTRVYLGVHSVIDVIAGVALGMVLAYLMEMIEDKKISE